MVVAVSLEGLLLTLESNHLNAVFYGKNVHQISPVLFYQHLLFGLHFLFNYSTTEVGAATCKVSETTYRKWVLASIKVFRSLIF